MKSMKNKWNSEKNKVVGAAKESAGKILGNPKLEAEGNKEHIKGHIQGAVENIKDAAKTALKKPH